ncbi:ABC transporter substrate-binding protein [Streptomyces hirsutus]|uniref:ABC transporter substrate-binding protein n=1 Tax=Streptomyces hirsutus TaxID=35620 RepID=UPI0036B95FE9
MRFTPTALTAATVAIALGLTGCSSATDDDGSGGAAAESGTRTVTDATGAEVEIPATPKRVVTTHYAATQPVLDLGFTPVGQASFEPGIIPEDILDKVEAVPVVTAQGEPDLEKIAGAEPDLIFAPNVYEEEVVEQLKEVAPVYLFTLRGGDRAKWTQRTDEVADALGVPEKADELAEKFEARQKKMAQTHADVIEGRSVAVIGAFEENNFYAWGENNMTGTLLLPLGFTWSQQENETVEGEAEPEAAVSHEKLASTVSDADVVLLDSNLRGEVNPFMAALQKTALYKDLPAVKAGNAYVAGKNTVAGYTDANYTLDRVEEALEEMGGE